MLPSRQAGAFRARPAAARAGDEPSETAAGSTLPLTRLRRYRGRLRRLQVPAPASLRERILRELRIHSPR